MVLQERVALVTGASRGIGRAIAYALAEAGADVAVAARDAQGLEKTAAGVRAHGREALVLPTDVLQPEQVKAMVAATVDHLGGLSILVNNAGTIVLKSFADTPIAAFREQMAIHYFAAVEACKAALPHMPHNGDGRIISLSSISGTVGYSYHSAYSPAKGALIRFSEALAAELKPNRITVNCIAPNAVDTALFDEWVAESGRELDRTDWIRPEEIGSLVVYLASPAGRSITGETIVIQGIYES